MAAAVDVAIAIGAVLDLAMATVVATVICNAIAILIS